MVRVIIESTVDIESLNSKKITISPYFNWRQEFYGSTINIFLYFIYEASITVTMQEGYVTGKNGQSSESFSFMVVYSNQPVRVNLSYSQTSLKRSQVNFSFTNAVDMSNLEDYFTVENGVASLFYFNGLSGHFVVSPKKAADMTVTVVRSKN